MAENRLVVRVVSMLFTGALGLMGAISVMSVMASGGCTSVYNDTIGEFARDDRTKLMERIDDALRTQNKLTGQLDTTRSAFATLIRRKTDGGRDVLHPFTLALQRSDLSAWNAHKQVLAISDVQQKLEPTTIEGQRADATWVDAQCEQIFEALEQANILTGQILDHMREPIDVLQTKPGPALRTALEHVHERVTALSQTRREQIKMANTTATVLREKLSIAVRHEDD